MQQRLRYWALGFACLLLTAACGGQTVDGGSTGGAASGGNATRGSGGGATAGSGGATTGGSGGSTGGTGGAPIDAGDCGCQTAILDWRRHGGDRLFTEVYHLHPCRTFLAERTFFDGSPPLVCKQELTSCASSITANDVVRALGDPDVQAALSSKTPVVFGVDSRPVDGSILLFQTSTNAVGVGEPCPTPAPSTCKPIPAGVSAFAALLTKLKAQELARMPCSGVFP